MEKNIGDLSIKLVGKLNLILKIILRKMRLVKLIYETGF